MKERAEAWAGKPSIFYSIIIPPELMWVIYTEYGIPNPYTISGPTGVAFVGSAGLTILPSVEHPPMAPTHAIGEVDASMMQNGTLSTAIKDAFIKGDYQVMAVTAYMKDYMEIIKQEIVESIATHLPGVNPPVPGFPLQGGRLHGLSASVVFAQNATVVEKDS
jgi:hypothetical protein